MSTYRPTYSDKRTGERRQQRTFWIEFVDHRDRRRSLAGFTSRRATEDLERICEALVAARATNKPPDKRTAEDLGRLPPKIRERLAAFDLIDATQHAASRPIADVIADFDKHLQDKGTTAKHRTRVVAICRSVCDAIAAQSLQDLDATKLGRDLRDRREAGLARATLNAHLRAMRSFCRWAVKRQLLDRDPTAPLSKLNEEQDRRYQRRAFEPDELRRLLRATETAEPFRGMPGAQRALIYRLAAETGIRLGELAQLRVGDFDLDGDEPTVRVPATASKNGQETTLPLRTDLAGRLRASLRGKLPSARALGIPGGWRAAETLRHDCAAANIETADELGRRLDFHSLRVAFVSALARSNLPVKTVQTLARHSTPVLTMNVYAKLGKGDERAALQHLPDLDAPAPIEQRATGTYDSLTFGPTFVQTFGNPAACQNGGADHDGQAKVSKFYDSSTSGYDSTYDRIGGDGEMADAAALKAAGRQRP